MNRRRTALVFIGLLIVALLFAYFIRPIIRQSIVEPILFAYLSVRYVLGSIGHGYYWALLIFVTAILMSRSLRIGRRAEGNRTYRGISESGVGRVAYWRQLLLLSSSGSLASEYSRMQIRRLMLSMLADVLHLTSAQVEQRLSRGELHLPEDVQTFLLQEQMSGYRKETSFQQKMRAAWGRLTGSDQRTIRPPHGSAQNPLELSGRSDEDLAALMHWVQWMEDDLERKDLNGTQTAG